ncbi:MAG TPA: hypothetical protein VFH52_11595 [Rhodanobacteraceae bacterium]|nr:hypothetical protein [Rhodanobacteraceae bacterium]
MKPAFLRWLIPATALLALSACTPGTKLQPPAASIPRLRVLPNGQWQFTLRIENYSYDTGMHVFAVNAQLDVGGKFAGPVVVAPSLDIPAMSADTTTVTFTPSVEAQAVLAASGKNAIAYEVKGILTVGKSEAGKEDLFDLDGKGYLSPVPGVANTWR